MKAILFLFDSLNRRYLSTYGCKDIYTPNFERLAKRATQFNNSYVASMPCIPARREIHTGRKNFLHREWGPIEAFDDSMPEILKKSGIYTHLISDHIHYWEEGGATYHTKYNTWEIVRGQEGDHWKGHVKDPDIPDVASVPQNQAGTDVSSMWRYDWVNREYMQTEEAQPQTKVVNLGLEFIKKNYNQDNWFLHIETFDPHEPFYVMEHYRQMYEKEYDGKPFDWPRGPVKESQSEIDHVRNNYRALVTMCDYNLGKLLDVMDRLDMWKDTMLIVGTDHGFMLGEHGYWAKNQVPYYNEVANTPMFIHDPRSNKGGEQRESLVQIIDWAPTILDYFNLEVPKDMEGKPLKKTIEDDSPVRQEALFGVFSGHVNVTDSRYVYMKAALPGKENSLYNYTLSTSKMHTPMSIENLKEAELIESPFSFTKGLKVLKIPAKDKYGVNKFGDMLFDLKEDPKQLNPIKDNMDLENKMQEKMIRLMEENEAPIEQYERIGLKKQ